MSDSVVTREDIFVCLTKMLSRERREDEDVLAHHVGIRTFATRARGVQGCVRRQDAHRAAASARAPTALPPVV